MKIGRILTVAIGMTAVAAWALTGAIAAESSAVASSAHIRVADHARLAGYEVPQDTMGSSGKVVPQTVRRYCTTGTSNGNVTTCFSVNGSGLYVQVMKVTACVHKATRRLFLEIASPTGKALAYDIPPGFYITPGSCHTKVYDPFKRVPGGNYCGLTYRANKGTTANLIGRKCINVHK